VEESTVAGLLQFLSSFLASSVEMVEALTIVLSIGAVFALLVAFFRSTVRRRSARGSTTARGDTGVVGCGDGMKLSGQFSFGNRSGGRAKVDWSG